MNNNVKVSEELYKCATCYKFVGNENKENKRRAKTSYKVLGELNSCGNNKYKFVICEKCLKLYTWSPNGRFFRFKKPNEDWHAQHNLYLNICKLGSKYGYDKRSVYTEVGFPDWAVNVKGNPLRFDIAIPSKKIVIEYNGQQHYTYKKDFHDSHDDYMNQRKNDYDKMECIERNGWAALLFTYLEDTSNIKWVERRLKELFEGLKKH